MGGGGGNNKIRSIDLLNPQPIIASHSELNDSPIVLDHTLFPEGVWLSKMAKRLSYLSTAP